MIMRPLLTSFLVLAASQTTAARLVTNLDMCAFNDPFDAQEMGMTLNETEMFEIEYFCEMSEPLKINWDSERIETRIGYCSEPGVISPQVWSFVFSPYDEGNIQVWEQGADAPVVFQSCKDDTPIMPEN